MAREVPTTLVTFGNAPHEERRGPLTIRVLAARAVRGLRTNPWSWLLFSALRPSTVVHCHQQHVLASSMSALWCRLTGRRVFVSDLGGGGWDVSGYVSTDAWYHGHLHISEHSRRVAGHESDSRAHVILGGVDTDRFAPEVRVPRSGRVLFVGRLLPHKGVDYLIEGLPHDMELTVVGPAPDEPYLRQLHELARDKRVTFRHDVGDGDLLQEYRSARCIVLPSVYRTRSGQTTQVPELLGQTLLEGMACGLPALATDVASLPEVVEDGVTGFLVPPNDPDALGSRLRWLREHTDEATRMGIAARERVIERFTWPEVVRRCLEVYRS
jgi:glycosyltransferase involved in cell wall biosynthesis